MENYEALITQSQPIADAMRKRDDLAGIFYTGGTTGRSKGVMLSHGNLMANAFNALSEGLWPSTRSICMRHRCFTSPTALRCIRCCCRAAPTS